MTRVRIRYADVASTLALCLALGGTAYATGILPAGSVGNTQLKAGSVSQSKLDFPLGVASATASAETLPPASNCGALGSCPVQEARPQARLSLKMTHSGVVLIDVGASLAAAATTVPDRVELHVRTDGSETQIASEDVPGASSQQVSGVSTQTLAPGEHSIALFVSNLGSSPVSVSNIELIATALPRLP
jgi:hypothetical protein